MEWIISIHTTLAGGDLLVLLEKLHYMDFNPHHPRGWRRDKRRESMTGI